jgi:hypothetical protein
MSALEKGGTQLVFEIAQAPAQRRLANVECFCRLSKASMLGCNNRPS